MKRNEYADEVKELQAKAEHLQQQIDAHKVCGQCGVVYGHGRMEVAWKLRFKTQNPLWQNIHPLSGVLGAGFPGRDLPAHWTVKSESPYITWRELCPLCYSKYTDPETHEYLPEGVKKKGGKK